MGKQYTQGAGSNPLLLPGVEASDSVTTDPLAGTVNDLNVAGSGLVSVINITASAIFTLTGIVGGVPGRELTLVNHSTFTGTLSAATGSAAANQFASAGSIASGQSVRLIYSGALNQWTLAAGGSGGSGSVTSVSVATALGVSGSVANPTTTPQLTIAATGRLLTFQVLTGSGTYTPTPGTTAIYVTAIGAGGGSGGCIGDATNNAASSGAGSGAWCSKYITSLLASYAYVCGTGGTAGDAVSTSGGNGSNTTFGAILTAPGGSGSAFASSVGGTLLDGKAGGGGGAIATGGDVNNKGNPGQFSIYGLGTIMVAGNARNGGGGGTPWGAGGTPGLTTGVAGSGIGGGAAGAKTTSTTGRVGAVGADGGILIWEYS